MTPTQTPSQISPHTPPHTPPLTPAATLAITPRPVLHGLLLATYFIFLGALATLWYFTVHSRAPIPPPSEGIRLVIPDSTPAPRP